MSSLRQFIDITILITYAQSVDGIQGNPMSPNVSDKIRAPPFYTLARTLQVKYPIQFQHTSNKYTSPPLQFERSKLRSERHQLTIRPYTLQCKDVKDLPTHEALSRALFTREPKNASSGPTLCQLQPRARPRDSIRAQIHAYALHVRVLVPFPGHVIPSMSSLPGRTSCPGCHSSHPVIGDCCVLCSSHGSPGPHTCCRTGCCHTNSTGCGTGSVRALLAWLCSGPLLAPLHACYLWYQGETPWPPELHHWLVRVLWYCLSSRDNSAWGLGLVCRVGGEERSPEGGRASAAASLVEGSDSSYGGSPDRQTEGGSWVGQEEAACSRGEGRGP